MIQTNCDVLIVGAGPAGLSAACAARDAGAQRVIVLERDKRVGGILQQCIHPGFGLKYFGEELTGPEYAERFYDKAVERNVEFMMGTMAIDFRENSVIAVNGQGVHQITFGAAVLAMGCRERTRANLVIPGSRPAGIYTAGSAQKLINIYGKNVGKKVVILGSGDIGMIMARRMSLEGTKVEAVVELMPYLAGLTRNKVQCLDDFDIPLMLSHTITEIRGVDRVSGVTVAPVDENRRPIAEKAFDIECDTVLLSVGLIPENELSKTAGVALSDITKGANVDSIMMTATPGIFACGNVLHVNDLVDNVSRESELAGRNAALYALGQLEKSDSIKVIADAGIRYVCPQLARKGQKDVKLFFRVTSPMGATLLRAKAGGEVLAQRKILRASPGEMEYLVLPEVPESGEIYVTATEK